MICRFCGQLVSPIPVDGVVTCRRCDPYIIARQRVAEDKYERGTDGAYTLYGQWERAGDLYVIDSKIV